MKNIFFFEEKSEIPKESFEKMIAIRQTISNTEELFDILSNEFQFPDYFGRNFDALYDSLVDYLTTNPKKTLIIHEKMPFTQKSKELELFLYIQIINDTTDRCKNLYVYFPKQYEDIIKNILIKLESSL
jgi:RNAse (barnase) inhibitor barstar